MSIPNKDEVEGKLNQAKGAVKETVGNVAGDRQLENEGKADSAGGDAQETWGKVKRGVGDAVDSVGDAISNAGKKTNQ